MSNELLWLIFCLVQFGLLVLTYKMFGLTGLYVWIGFGIVAANLQVVKSVDMFGISATLGNIIYGSIFLATDLINEKYGRKHAQRAVLIGFVMMVSFTIITQLALRFAPNEFDFAQGALETLFSIQIRITAGSLIAYLISQTLDVYLFDKIKSKFGSPNQLWIRNNGSTLVSQAIDTAIFTFIAFLGVFPFPVVMEIFWFSYVIKIATSLIDTPFVYWMRGIQPKEI
ncbi:VUT family protein [Acidaminobacter sp. JC074]|uniref:queuosine precursor transporter n=1 Tax=Acidaminobacter sp. JC074 TaxID=2530199 RepID=UPI001F0EB1E6|nr:queuosine precursor transporter [Acidaminobacter sp. JC074]MCH4888479.1 VUT family protein [Acidaminobacter sp. JC074]